MTGFVRLRVKAQEIAHFGGQIGNREAIGRSGQSADRIEDCPQAGFAQVDACHRLGADLAWLRAVVKGTLLHHGAIHAIQHVQETQQDVL